MKSLALRPCGPLDTRTYVLVVSGTFNPPHRGHLRLGLFAKERLEKLGHQVEAVCFLPVHDNYMLNKQTLAAKSGSSGAEVFYPMAARCDFLRALLRREEPRTERTPQEWQERVQVKYKDQALLPRELGHFENVNSSGHALLLLLPALRGPDEHLSSTQLRKRLVELLASARSHGCDEDR
eukprot:g12045.t1